MSSDPISGEIGTDARWLAQALDAENGLVRLVPMDAAAYRDASFLDDRMMVPGRESVVVPWSEAVAALPADARTDARWIFHIGHVGSTLVARLLGELGGVLSVREPRILRDVAMLSEERRAEYLAQLQKLLSRTFSPDELALVKATSFVSEIAPELMPPGERALFLYASPRAYIASILAGPNSVQELAALGPSLAQRVAGRFTLAKSSNGAEAAAAAWACEMTALEAAADAMPDRKVAWADFDRMLCDMAGELANVADFFGFSAAPGQIEAIAAGPLMGRYSKALEYEYSPSLRLELIAEADAANRADIDSAIAMLHSAAARSSLLARALDRSH
ncbi:hypothetical protein BH24PSE1_BH24PSE1_07390 [soil metagenome]